MDIITTFNCNNIKKGAMIVSIKNQPPTIMSKSSSPLTIVAITTAAPGKEDGLRAAQEKLVEETVKESGCLRYELHQSLEDKRILVFVESWATEERWRAHMQGAAIKGFQASGASDLIQDFSLFRMNLVANGRPA
jgi:quinol monooxygenase YgiN